MGKEVLGTGWIHGDEESESSVFDKDEQIRGITTSYNADKNKT